MWWVLELARAIRVIWQEPFMALLASAVLLAVAGCVRTPGLRSGATAASVLLAAVVVIGWLVGRIPHAVF